MRRLVMTLLAAAAIVTSGAVPGRAAECKLTVIPAKLVESRNGSILLSVQLGDRPAVFMLDTGGSWSVIRRRSVGNLHMAEAPLKLYGAGGTKMDQYVRISSFKIGPLDVPNMELMVAPDEMSTDDRIDGILGANFLHNFDLEIDLANNVVNFFMPSDCGARAVYWPHQDVAAIPIEKDDNHLIHVTMSLDDKQVRTLIDTGATQTILSLAAADDRFDLRPDSPGVERAGNFRTADGKDLPTFRHQFRVLALDNIQFLNPWVALAEDRVSRRLDSTSRQNPLILGTHQLRQLHLYIAYRDRMLYATAAAGPVTGATVGPAQPAAVTKPDAFDWDVIRPLRDSAQNHLKARQPDLALADAAEILRRYPNAAVGYVLRGLIEADTGKLEDAVADFSLAIKIDPAVGDYYTLRSRALKQLHRDDLAKADLDQAIALAPK